MDPSVCLPDESNLHAQYPLAIQDYEQYSSECANSSIYVTKSPVLVPRVGPQCSYRTDQKSCSIIGGPSQQIVQDADMAARQQEHAMVPTIRYIQSSQYDELSEYGLTTASCAVDSHYVEDPTIAYGYVSEATYGIQSNTNAFASRPLLFDDNLNGSGNLISAEPKTHNFENHHDFQSKMSQLTLNPIDVSHQMRDVKEELLDGSSSDMCTPTRWRDPNLAEVISFLNNPNNAIKANAAAYLQHLCYMDDPNKQRTRTLGGIPPLIGLLSYDIPEIHKNACGALRNLSYGRQHDENKRAIKNAGGITSLVNLLNRSQESEVKELVTGILWNMSSCEDIKRAIIDESLNAIVNNIIKPHSGWDAVCPGDTCFSLAFRNASGVLRNVSSAGEYARSSLRNAEYLIECLLYVVKKSIEKNNIGNKTVENCVCILRNLSYRCQEVEDPNYDKQIATVPSRSLSTPTQGENLGCFGTSKKRKEYAQSEQQENSFVSGPSKTLLSNSGSLKGYEQLWQPEVVQYYLALLQSCSNPETLEAAAGAIQNLSACFWQPSIDIRATVRKEKGLPILVELLRMEVDRVVCAVATALRNLAIDQRNKELIGKYAMRDLVQKLPSGNLQHDQTTSDDTISAVLATINEVIKRNTEFSRSLLDAGGVDRLMNITRNRQNYTPCVLKFASQVLLTMWQHYDLRDVYKKNGWKEQDFVTKALAGFNAAPNSPNNANNTLNRPMASQGRTKYEDRTIQRISNNGARSNDRGMSIYNESHMGPQMVPDGSVNDGDKVCQRSAQASGLYIPISDGTRNHSN